MLRTISKLPSRLLASRFSTAPELADDFDPFCDPANPLQLDFSQISIAQHKLRNGVEVTPCRLSRFFSELTKSEVYLKMETNQDTGSFKERGARLALLNLTDEEKRNGVFAASAGNHALALSIHGKMLGIPVHVVMPRHAPLMKITKCRELGADIIVQGKDISCSRKIALKKAKENGGKYINGYDYIDILAGAGTVGMEILEQVPHPDFILVPVGGGGLIAGVATAVKALCPDTKIIGIEPEACPSMKASLDAGKPIYTKTNPSLADGLLVPNVGVNAFASTQGKVDKMLTIREKHISLGILRLVENEKVVCEGAGAISVAGLLSGHLRDEIRGKRVVAILSGGNIDSTALGTCIMRGLSYEGRMIKFSAVVSDRPGGVSELTQLISGTSANIKHLGMERAFLREDVFSTVKVNVVAETRGVEHVNELRGVLEKRYGTGDIEFIQYQ